MRTPRPNFLTHYLHRWGRLLLFLSIIAALLALYPGCADPHQRYRLLSTFFDGVPVPEDYPEPVTQYRRGPWGRLVEVQPDTETDQSTAARQQAQAQPQTPIYYHRPYAEHDCTGCHAQTAGYQVIDAPADTCRRCHDSHFNYTNDTWVHGPVVFDQCARCHQPHKSEYPGLLTAPQPDLCFTCHDPDFIKRDPFHNRLDDLTCSNCHDPHAAGNRKLLVDSRTYQNRRIFSEVQSAHPAWDKDNCDQCHLPEKSNQLREDVDQVCLTCHEDQTTPAADQQHLHPAVADGSCTSCHTPHRSPRPNLIRPRAEDNCLQCHQLQQVNTLPHPNVTRVECLMCHAGHTSDRPHLLKPGIDQPLTPTPDDTSPDQFAKGLAP